MPSANLAPSAAGHVPVGTWIGGLLMSLAAIVIGTLWLVIPASYPFGRADRVTVSISHLIENDAGGAMLLVAGGVGVLLSSIGLRENPGRSTLRLVAAVASVEAAFFGFVLSDASVISTLGYAVALGTPIAIVTGVVIACVRRQPVGWIAAGLLLGLVVAGGATGLLGVDAVIGFVRNVLVGFADFGPRILWSWGMAAAAAGWAFVTVHSLRRASVGGAADPAGAGRLAWATPQAAHRWGRVVTIAAAVCPLPYAALRMTWLTPWPFGLEPLYGTPGARLQGVAIGVGAVVGCVLTLGLISRWGRAFPGWVPILHGRAVPVRFAVVPGVIVAIAISLAAPGMVVSTFENGESSLGLLLFPFPIWGPLLGAAVLAYWLRRRTGEVVV